MNKKKSFIKIYTGLILFLINLFFFFFFTWIDKKFNKIFFIYFCLFFILVIMICSVKEVLKSKQLLKNNFLKFIYFIFSFIFFYLFFLCLFCFYFNNPQLNDFSKIFSKKIHLPAQLIYLKQSFQLKQFLFYFFFLFIFVWFCFLFVNKFRTENLNFLLLILIYIVLPSACFFTLICLNYEWFVYLFVITIANDSFAYLGGILFGKHLLYPKISPKKTWEGSLYGVIISLIIVFCIFDRRLLINKLPFYIFTFCNCIIAQIGDLIASKFKRDFLIKDFDSVIPGHGGFLDRFDSLFFLSFFVIFILSIPREFICF